MKRFVFSLMALTCLTALGQEEKPFSIDGSLKDIPGAEKVYLMYVKGGQRVTDSANVSNGKYAFKGALPEPSLAMLSVKYAPFADGTPKPLRQRRDSKSVFLSPGKLQLASTDSFSNIKISGSPVNDEWNKFNAQIKPLSDKIIELNTQYLEYSKAKNLEGAKKVEEEYEGIEQKMSEATKAFIDANPNSSITPYLLNQYAGPVIDADKVQPLLDKLSPEAKKLPSIIALAGRTEIARKTSVGRMAIDFTQNDTSGKPVSLSSFRGKVLLVDFWASWCGPCRRENPNVVKAFNQYKDKGFHILGVSLDQPGAKEKWLKAIHDDNLTWTHVSDLKYWNNDVATEYGIRSIPFNLLLDKDGKIIAKNLRGEALEKKLAEIFL